MTIPSRFKLLGHTWTVRAKENLWKRKGVWGQCSPGKLRITLQEPNAQIVPAIQEETFCHELTHAILSTMGSNELNQNEKFVEEFGALLYQALTSMENE